jgi:hypothetical protein
MGAMLSARTAWGAAVVLRLACAVAASAVLGWPTGAAAQSEPTTKQKVGLYEQSPGDPPGKSYVGSVVWRTEAAPPIAVRAEIEIPERNMLIRWSLRRNDDGQVRASHTMEIVFTLPPDFPHGGIANVTGVLMKPGETMRGLPLNGVAVKVMTNSFLISLSPVDADRQRNIQLLKEQSWIDIPVVYGDGRRAIIAIEKGTPGERAFADAFAAWDQ